MKESKRKLIVGGLGVLGASIASFSVKAQKKPEFTMVFAHTFSQASEKYVVTGIDLFKELAEKYTDNRLLVDVHEGGKLGGQNVLPQKVQQGAIQACQLSMQNFTPFSESFNLLDFPYVFSSNDRFERFLESDLIQNSLLASEQMRVIEFSE
jgi:C4-dicarboxylate-binding protein DctP